MPRFKTSADILKIVSNKEQIRNIGIIAHVDHGKTTMTDSLLSGAGLLSPSLAGTALAMDFMEEEQKRQMTIKAANVSLYYEHNGMPFVINLIDTPGTWTSQARLLGRSGLSTGRWWSLTLLRRSWFRPR